ncbi:hypothetical protein GQX73_g6263 [Xylaria multiplex]|uniref:Uncharacterized protein n=1 Tax=Xylaria multiplex TaxID=323545 RepID=A0A7C8IZF5_9PEZI|nr:hypothetical protein GQX73_g6263 [Xylaria multiplex]
MYASVRKLAIYGIVDRALLDLLLDGYDICHKCSAGQSSTEIHLGIYETIGISIAVAGVIATVSAAIWGPCFPNWCAGRRQIQPDVELGGDRPALREHGITRQPPRALSDQLQTGNDDLRAPSATVSSGTDSAGGETETGSSHDRLNIKQDNTVDQPLDSIYPHIAIQDSQDVLGDLESDPMTQEPTISPAGRLNNKHQDRLFDSGSQVSKIHIATHIETGTTQHDAPGPSVVSKLTKPVLQDQPHNKGFITQGDVTLVGNECGMVGNDKASPTRSATCSTTTTPNPHSTEAIVCPSATNPTKPSIIQEHGGSHGIQDRKAGAKLNIAPSSMQLQQSESLSLNGECKSESSASVLEGGVSDLPNSVASLGNEGEPRDASLDCHVRPPEVQQSPAVMGVTVPRPISIANVPPVAQSKVYE